jgi:hypothetical protein
MKKGTLKEFGKVVIDLSKITFAVVIIAPLAKGGNIEVLPILLVGLTIALGLYIYNKGEKNE